MASPTQWTQVWVDSGSWWWTGRPGVLWFIGLQRVRHDWATELNWKEIPREFPWPFCHVRTPREGIHLQTRKWVLTRFEICWHLDIRFLASRITSNMCLLARPSSLCHFYSSLNELGQKARGSLLDSILASHQAPHLWIIHDITWQPRRRCVQVLLHQSSWFNAHLCTSVQYQFSCSVMSDSLRFHGLQHTRLPCPSPTPRAYSNSWLLCWWCHPTISSSVVPFPSCPQSFPASGYFQMSQLVAAGGQSTGVSASTSVLPMNIQDWSPLGWTGWTSLQSKALSRVFSNSTVQKQQFFGTRLSS